MDEVSILRQKLRAMEELAGDGYWEWTIDVDTMYVCDRFLNLLGYTSEDTSSDFLRGITDPDDLKRTDIAKAQCLSGKARDFCETIKYRAASGEWIHVESRGKLVYNDGRPYKMVGVNTNVSEIHKMTQQLEIERDRAIASSKSSKIFLANMSHEIRTPMNTVVTLSELMLRDKSISARHREYMNCISGSANILLQLLGDILEFSKLESLELSLDNKKCHMKNKRNLIYNSWHEKFSAKGLKFKVHLSSRVPEYVVMDRQRFFQITNILLSNALKYTDTGKVSVCIYVNGDMLNVRVKDTGPGIPKKTESILDPFVRANTRKEGTGLGLSIAQSIIEKIGGKVWYTSRVGSGSSFYFSYPIDKNVDDHSSENLIDTTSFEEEHLNVLVVEDNQANRFVMQEILKEFPTIRVDMAESGEESLVCVSNNKYDIIFMDVVMPGMNGDETTLEIRKIDTEVYIVATTANSISGDREKYTRIMNDYISKPILMCELKKVLRRYSTYRESMGI